MQDLASTPGDLSLTFSHDPASGIASVTRSNDAYAFVQANANVTDTHNGLNQIVTAGGGAVAHDVRGNVTGVGGATYWYTSDNQMTASVGHYYMHADAIGRMRWGYHLPSTRYDFFNYDSASGLPVMIAEHDGTGALRQRYVHGPGVDEPLVWYEGAGTSDRRWLHADERGSVIAVSDGDGDVIATNAYDEYGNPQGGSITGRFGYTGQAWLPELGMYYYRARIYNPGLGRFMQTDPIGYGAGMNLYAYVMNDPANFIDPSGLCSLVTQWSAWKNEKGELVGKEFVDSWFEGCDTFDTGGWQSSPHLNWLRAAGSLGSSGRLSSRPLTPREADFFACNGVDRGMLNEIILRNSMDSLFGGPIPGFVQIFSNAGALTIGNDIYYRSGYPENNSIFTDRDTMRLLAHEIGHSIQYAHGMTIESYLSGWVKAGSYSNHPRETDARNFADGILERYDNGYC